MHFQRVESPIVNKPKYSELPKHVDWRTFDAVSYILRLNNFLRPCLQYIYVNYYIMLSFIFFRPIPFKV